MEYMMVAGFVLLLTIPLVIVFVQQSTSFNDKVSLTQSEKAIRKVIDSSDTIYYLGPPSKRTISIYLPQNVKNITVINNSIDIEIYGGYLFSVLGESQLNGTLSSFEGLHTVTVEAKSNFVQITG